MLSILAATLPWAGSAAETGAGEPVPAASPLTLEAAVSFAEQHSPMVVSAHERHRAAEAQRNEMRGMRLPTITAREIALRTDSPADAFGLQLMQERFSFPSFVASDPNRPDAIDDFATELVAEMPVFTGGRLHAGVAAAGRMADAAKGIETHTRRAVALETARAYLMVLHADEGLRLAENARATTARHVDQARAFHEAGMIVESDLLQAQVQLARMDEAVIRARNGASLARAGLGRAMGSDQAFDYRLAPAPPAPPVDTMDVGHAYVRALEGRGDTRAVRAGTEAASLGVKGARGGLLPSIGLMGKFAWHDPDHVFGTSGDSYAVMAVASWTIFDGGSSWFRLSRSLREEAAARAQKLEHEQRVQFEVREAKQAIAESRARLGVATDAVAAAERAHAILEERFGQGVARVTDLLDAETMLNEARLRELEARFEVQKSVRTYLFVTGQSPVPEVVQ